MNHWLMKSEPAAWSWDQMVAAKTTAWSGVRNNAAALHMKHMKRGDLAFFYHSNEGKEIVGVIEIIREYHPDPSDAAGRFGMVEVKAIRPLKTPVTLAQIKVHATLKNLALVKQSRLSVSPVDAESWKIICKLGGIEAKEINQ